MNILKILIAASALAFSSLVSASIIDKGAYQYDTETNLQWLDLSLTDGMSAETALSVFSNDGWVLATEKQFDLMYDNYDGSLVDGSVYASILNYTLGASGTNIGIELVQTKQYNIIDEWGSNPFMRDFGLTVNDQFDIDQNGIVDSHLIGSLGLYQSDVFPDLMQFGGIYYSVSADAYDDLWDQATNHVDRVTYIDPTRSQPDYGVFLVREVPEPSILALMFTGIIGLGIIRRKVSVE